MILVTGASGHLGANLVRRLLADGHEVRVLLRAGSDNGAVAGLDVAVAYGDLRDPAALKLAAAGCGRVYHCAAMLSTVPGHERELYDCNVLGTRNLLAACRDAGVERVVVTGSFSAVGHQAGRPSVEEMPFYPFGKLLPYAHTKALVEHECLKAVVDGLDVVMAVSTAILGPNDYKPSRMGRLLLDFAHGRLRAYLPGGFEFVSASDLVRGHLLAMGHGRSGQRYIFSTSFLSVDELMGIYETVTGRRRPALRLPESVMAGLAGTSERLFGKVLPAADRRFTPAAVAFLRSRRRADCGRARDELGYRPTDISTAVSDAYDGFVRRGLIPVPARRPTVAEVDREARR
jgi:nucleoside-diphosphate-sugar epimerase